MNCLSNAPSYAAAIFRRTSQVISRNFLYGSSVPAWSSSSTRAFENAAVRTVSLGFFLTRERVHYYSSKRSRKAASKVKSFASEQEANQEKDAFFVVRKGDLVGVYRSFRDCLAQVGSSVCDPPVSVYKGYLLPKDAEDYLGSHGLKNAMYTIRAADLRDDLFGMLSPCPIQEPASSTGNYESREISQDAADEAVSKIKSSDWMKKNAELALNHTTANESPQGDNSCTIEFDGASKGNPGKSGAGAVLRSNDGSLICRLCEGAGRATNNVAEYRGIILGLKYALKRGYTNVRVQGDSKLICMQVNGLWKVKHENIAPLFKEVTELKQNFRSFEIHHVVRALNSEADALANRGVNLDDGQIEEECVSVVQMA